MKCKRIFSQSHRRTVLKQCAKCGKRSRCKPRERFCKQQRYGPRSYACWGALVHVRAVTKSGMVTEFSTASAIDPVLQKAQRGERWRAAAGRKAKVAGAMMEKYRAAAVKAHKREQKTIALIEKWARKAEQQERRAAMTDDDVQAVYDRALHAQHVRKVQRRLLGKAKHDATLEPQRA